MSLPIETWRPVVGYEGFYEVSDHGRVRSLDRTVGAKGGGVRPIRGRLLSPYRQPDGRGQVLLSMDAHSQHRLVYRLVLEAFVGPCPPDMEGCHNNGNAADDRLENLRWDTRSENQLDTVRHGRHNKASRTHCPNGHPLAAPNLMGKSSKEGRRQCLACNRAHSYANWSRRVHSVVLDHKSLADDYYSRIRQTQAHSMPRDLRF